MNAQNAHVYLTPPPKRDAELKALRTQIANQRLRIAAMEAAAREKDAKILRLQELVADQDGAIRAMQDLRKRWG